MSVNSPGNSKIGFISHRNGLSFPLHQPTPFLQTDSQLAVVDSHRAPAIRWEAVLKFLTVPNFSWNSPHRLPHGIAHYLWMFLP